MELKFSKNYFSLVILFDLIFKGLATMSDRYHRNPYADFDSSGRNMFLNDKNEITPDLIETITALQVKLLKLLNNNVDEILTDSNRKKQINDFSVYTGLFGISLYYFHNYMKTNKKSNLEKAIALSNIGTAPSKRISFLNGLSGSLSLSAVYHFKNDDSALSKKYTSKLVNLSDSIKNNEKDCDEFLYGRVGYLYALIFANKHLGDDIISNELIRNITEKILRSGYEKSKKDKNDVPLSYEWHEKNYLGAAHGVAGILYILLCTKDILTEHELNDLIKPTIDWLLLNRYRSGNFPSSYNKKSDDLVQWCHGAPGFIHLLVKANEIYKEEKYLNAAIEAGNVIWQRGLLTKGYSICHGVTGNAYAFLHLYKNTKNAQHLYRAACFTHWITKYPMHQELEPDRPYSLFEGISGILYYLSDFKDPKQASFPAYEL